MIKNYIKMKVNKSLRTKEFKEVDSIQNTISLSNIIDYRFFEVHNFNTPVVLFIYTNSANHKLLKLFDELEIFILATKSNKLGPINVDDYIEEGEDYHSTLTSGIEKGVTVIQYLLDQMGKSTIKRPHPKLLIYTDDEDCVPCYFTLFNIIHNYSNKYPDIELTFITNDSILTTLRSGMNTLFFPTSLFTKKGIGLLPISQKANLSTSCLYYPASKYI
jgi:hypothetical protein